MYAISIEYLTRWAATALRARVFQLLLLLFLVVFECHGGRQQVCVGTVELARAASRQRLVNGTSQLSDATTTSCRVVLGLKSPPSLRAIIAAGAYKHGDQHGYMDE